MLAGGHSLLPMMKLRLASPEYVIDIDPLAGRSLGYVDARDGEIRIGAMTRHNALLESPAARARLAIFTDAERVIADPVVRNRGTIGGALCQADPSEDLSAVCAAVEAQLVIRGRSGERVVDMHEFHRGPYETAVGPAEMLVEIRVPLRPRTGSAYLKVDRRVGDWAVVAAGRLDRASTTARSRGAGLALAAVGGDITCPRPRRRWSARAARRRALRARGRSSPRSACEPVTDQRGSADYKRHVVGVLTERVLRRATERARGD